MTARPAARRPSARSPGRAQILRRGPSAAAPPRGDGLRTARPPAAGEQWPAARATGTGFRWRSATSAPPRQAAEEPTRRHPSGRRRITGRPPTPSPTSIVDRETASPPHTESPGSAAAERMPERRADRGDRPVRRRTWTARGSLRCRRRALRLPGRTARGRHRAAPMAAPRRRASAARPGGPARHRPGTAANRPASVRPVRRSGRCRAQAGGRPTTMSTASAPANWCPTQGSRRARAGESLYHGTFGLINLGPSPDERWLADLETKIRSLLRGTYKIGVFGKGGVGKTHRRGQRRLDLRRAAPGRPRGGHRRRHRVRQARQPHRPATPRARTGSWPPTNTSTPSPTCVQPGRQQLRRAVRARR